MLICLNEMKTKIILKILIYVFSNLGNITQCTQALLIQVAFICHQSQLSVFECCDQSVSNFDIYSINKIFKKLEP
ncbi:hypothetical protein VNO80_21949 [Phaseolus coccineus]|uniref:Uncharacterized protein n=1 Tax=Phaseolus coccineus TaxID=3886 RepID=A0AAN9QTT9_PHACN